MPERKRHILIDRFVTSEDFRSRKKGRNRITPKQDRLAHGQYLSSRYSALIGQFETQHTQIENPITEDVGIYVEIVSVPEGELPLESLDTRRDFTLRSCRKEDDREVAVIFIPESKRYVFQRKLEEYLEGVINFIGLYPMVYNHPQSALFMVGCAYGTKALSK